MKTYQPESFETIRYEKGADRVLTLTLDRPQRMNSFNQRMLDEVRSAWHLFQHDPDLRAAVVAAAGDRAFCTGVDVVESIDESPDMPFDERDPGESLGPKQNLVWKPVITAVQGLCAGGAFYLLNESDIIICSQDAQFFDPHVSFGLVSACEPIGAMHRMPYGEIIRMVLMGNDERITADTALRIGLVSQVVPREELLSTAHALAAKIAEKPTIATQGTVRALWEALDMPYLAAVRNSYKYTQIGNRLSRLKREEVVKAPYTLR
ncbi:MULTISPECIES: enoyl-CoA hydratase/isomerase family protein [unclassified Sphingobium]|uniref:enoyl-CoA hydratase/isomerase family protein n=1 Tax=unclassified Sphingobium TaxID=2611147 RepID=UPI0035A73F98